jgi:hypothetical protein
VSLPAGIARALGRDLPAAGDGPLLYPALLPLGRQPAHPAAADLCRIVAEGHAEVIFPEPLYLRRPDAREPGAPKRVTEAQRVTETRVTEARGLTETRGTRP